MNIRNNIWYSCKKAVPKPCPQRSFPGRQVHYVFSQCLSVNSSINIKYIVSQESLLKSWLHISSLNLSDADGLLCSLPRWRRDHLLFIKRSFIIYLIRRWPMWRGLCLTVETGRMPCVLCGGCRPYILPLS